MKEDDGVEETNVEVWGVRLFTVAVGLLLALGAFASTATADASMRDRSFGVLTHAPLPPVGPTVTVTLAPPVTAPVPTTVPDALPVTVPPVSVSVPTTLSSGSILPTLPPVIDGDIRASTTIPQPGQPSTSTTVSSAPGAPIVTIEGAPGAVPIVPSSSPDQPAGGDPTPGTVAEAAPPPASNPNGEFDSLGAQPSTGGDATADATDASAPRSTGSTGSTVTDRIGDYAFPLGLAILIIAFLLIQHRLDAGDPKLAENGSAEAPPLSFDRASRVP